MSFKTTIRGTPTRVIAADYVCPRHGRFEFDVERNENGDAPDVIACPIDDNNREPGPDAIGPTPAPAPPAICGEPAEWCISAPMTRVRRIEAVKGKWAKPEKKTYTDTTNVGEGQPLYEWHEDRAKIWEERRKEDVMAFARENHERPIGGE